MPLEIFVLLILGPALLGGAIGAKLAGAALWQGGLVALLALCVTLFLHGRLDISEPTLLALAQIVTMAVIAALFARSWQQNVAIIVGTFLGLGLGMLMASAL